ncbi:MAG TPA: hypothetical protein VGC40_01425 [Paenirhodobacter sp.]
MKAALTATARKLLSMIAAGTCFKEVQPARIQLPKKPGRFMSIRRQSAARTARKYYRSPHRRRAGIPQWPSGRAPVGRSATSPGQCNLAAGPRGSVAMKTVRSQIAFIDKNIDNVQKVISRHQSFSRSEKNVT